jgi:hypothetical protein
MQTPTGLAGETVSFTIIPTGYLLNKNSQNAPGNKGILTE